MVKTRLGLLAVVLTSALLIAALALPSVAHAAASWQTVGGGGISDGTANYTSMAVDSTNTPFAAFTDSNVGDKVVVKKYTGSAWVNVGVNGISAGGATYVALALDSSNLPYVAYADTTNGSKLTVLHWNGTAWAAVGGAVSGGQILDLSFITGPSGTLYASYRDAANSNKITVMKWDGAAWASVGAAGFSIGEASFTSIALNSSGTPYVSFQDANSANKATVMRFNGTAWVNVGTGQVSSGIGNYSQIKLTSSNVVVLAYRDGDQAYKASSAAFLGSSSWANFGGTGFSDGQADYLSLDLDSGGTPYLAYRDAGNASKATVMFYNGATWVPQGAKGFSAGAVTYTSLAHDGNGSQYVAYVDAGTSGKAVVKKYTPEYNLTFDEQGGSTVSDSSQASGASVTLPNAPTRANYSFGGWNTASDGSGTSYNAGASYAMPGSDTTLYAIWEPTDSDIVPISVENGAPNGGDGNNDGTPDSQQSNIGSFVNSKTGEYMTVELDSACTITGILQTTTPSDTGYTYPLGLLNFTANCGTPNYTTAVKLYYYSPPTASYSLRKSTANVYQTAPGATASSQTIGGKTVLTFAYHVTDGGSMDTDGITNGIIIDPVGPAVQIAAPVAAAAVASGALANTGSSPWVSMAIALALTTIALATRFFIRQKQ